VFAAVTGWNRLKNLKSLLEAYQIVRQKLPRAELKVIGAVRGNGKGREQGMDRAGLFDGVTLLGRLPYRESLDLIEHEVDVVVHPTLEESFSMVTLEAMAKGVPVIGGVRSGAVPWLLDHGRAGVVVNVRRPADIACEMINLVNDPGRYAELASVAYRRAIENFTLDRVIARYLEVYQKVLRSAGKVEIDA
jgi:glycosyltransferase involved in cell wall biosynthesis